jgi:LL-diaminopimelate aminotransferase
MATINPHYAKLSTSYLFSEIARRVSAFREANPGAELFNLGIGNTTEPLPPSIVAGLAESVEALAAADTYTGYGDEQGDTRLRQALASHYAILGVTLRPNEIFISDGAKPDTANLQSIFGSDSVVAVQDPVYPVYVDSAVIAGRTDAFREGRYDGLVYMPCLQENGFVPEVPDQRVDIIYLCSPNNPTGAVATHEQLAKFVAYARSNHAVIIFDAAYAAFVTDPSLPRSIYEVAGAKKCAIEVNSFSKSAGFTGVRLGWAVVPHELVVQDIAPGEVRALWHRRQTTMFNGASNIAQAGGLAALSDQGQREAAKVVRGYLQNARLIKAGLEEVGLQTYGGTNAPYIWTKTPNDMGSWDFFEQLLQEAHVVCTPGVGFGPLGDGYVRFSAFGHQADIQGAVASITKHLRSTS